MKNQQHYSAEFPVQNLLPYLLRVSHQAAAQAEQSALNTVPDLCRRSLRMTLFHHDYGSEFLVRNDMGTVFCKFDNGRSLGMIPGEDSFHKIQEEVQTEEICEALLEEPDINMTM